MGRILGKRIMLREYKKEDLIYIRKWVNNPNITKYLSDIFLYPHTLNETENFLDSILEGKTKGKNFIIANKDTEEYLGQIDLLTIDWKNRVGLLGIVLGQEANLGKGYGEEAIRLLLDYSFNNLI
ncbi:GNAT family N-acetyltransferase [Clostridium sp. KNHs214]|uniref:GNAT family N-acetyltransferase n=1 Tax=Clostridium sp. KNHs214 TaxID=1540257 RepID=UPI000A7B1B68|nr:GNAT family N-acetyltransferase [Clostridium sp. KNHs214]